MLLWLVSCRWPVVSNRGVKLRFNKEAEAEGKKDSYYANEVKEEYKDGYPVYNGHDPARGPHGKRQYHRE
jgi:hypothetical protein